MSVYNIIIELQNTSSRLEKEAILQRESANHELKQFFFKALEPRLNFFIKKIPAYSLIGGNQTSFDTAMMALGALSSRSVTGHAGIGYLKNVLSSCSMEDALMLERIINKDPKCGVSVSTVNKIWPGLITDVPYMRCSLPKDSNIDKLKWEEGVFSQLKADGMFGNVSITDITSRAGSEFPIDQFKNIVDAMEMCGGAGNQFHGEFVVERDGELLPRQISNGIMNSVLKGESFPANCRPIYMVWDTIPIKEAVAKNKYRVPYKTRFEKIQKMFGHLDETSPVRIIETRIVYSYEEAYAHYKEVRKRTPKGEGTVIKSMDTIWEDTTSKDQIKMKAEVEIDLKVVGFNDANKTSKNSGMFGSLQCESSDGLLAVGVTGLTDDFRKELFDMGDELLGKVITVTTNELLEPSKNNPIHSVFIPRFKELRLDKTEADSLEQIKKIFDSVLD